METLAIAVSWALTIVAGLWIGSYFSPYLKKRAENLATHDDLDKLVAEMKATTEATKAIEARIDDQVWNKQRQWEIKRDMLFEGCRIMAEFNNALLRISTIYSLKAKQQEKTKADELAFTTHEGEALSELNKASKGFERARLLISIVGGNEVQRALMNMETILKKLSGEMVNGGNTTYLTFVPLIQGAEKVVIEAMRKELGIEA